MVTDLKEIKSGEVGRGLLIENDGYISLSDEHNKELFESIKSDGNNVSIPNPFIVNAVFQKFNIKNANGRIYPEKILKREVDKYQIKIKERRGYGECYTPDTLILTKNGWKTLGDVVENEEILTLNVDTNNIEIQSIVRKVEYEFKGNMIRIKGDNINDLVTPNHGFPTFVDGDFNGFYTATEILENKVVNQDVCYIPTIDGAKIYLNKSSINVYEEQYNGTVMCVEVPNHTWYCKCNDKCHWTKNCNHPSDSVIDLGRIAMNIIELHWEGNTLVGKIEIPLSPGFRKFGIISCLADMVGHWILSNLRVGVSSRGLGTVEQHYGDMIVGDDFELVCWDFVSEPSTPGAWVSQNSNDLSQFIERYETNKSVVIESELSRFNEWLNSK